MNTTIVVELPVRDEQELRNTRELECVESVTMEQGALHICRTLDGCHIEDIFAPGQWYSVTSYSEGSD